MATHNRHSNDDSEKVRSKTRRIGVVAAYDVSIERYPKLNTTFLEGRKKSSKHTLLTRERATKCRKSLQQTTAISKDTMDEISENPDTEHIRVRHSDSEMMSQIRRRTVSFADNVQTISNSPPSDDSDIGGDEDEEDEEDDVDMDALWLQHKLRTRTSRSSIVAESGTAGLWNRRNSIVNLPKNKSPLTFTRHRRVSLTPGPVIPKRRTSTQGSLSRLLTNYHRESLTNEVRPRLAVALGLDYEESQFAQITEKTIELCVPVFTISTPEKNVCVTDIKSIEDALCASHPEVTFLKNVEQAKPSAELITRSSDGRSFLQSITEADPIEPVEPESEYVHTDRRFSIRTCVKRMRSDSTNYDLQLSGCENVGRYASMETLKVVLSKQDAIDCVLKAMMSFSDREELQSIACKSMLDMASASANNCKIIHDMKGVPVLINTIERFSHKADIVRIIMRIFGFMSTCDDLIYYLVESGCHSHVLRMMSEHGQDSSIVYQCCVILGNMVTTVTTAEEIMKVGGIHTIINMMDNFPKDADILENGCRAIGCFAALDEICLDVALAGGTKAIISAMTLQKSNISLQESGCWALACLTCMADTCEELLQMDGVDDILDSLEIHSKEESIQEYGIRAINNLAILDTTVESVSNERVIVILQRAVIHFPYNAELLENVTSVLNLVLQTDDVIKETFIKKDGVTTVTSAMKLHEENIPIQQYGCTILGNLAVNENLRRETEEGGASKAIIAAMLTLDTTEEIQEYGCMALINLTADEVNNKIRVMNNGGVMAILCCLQNFYTSPDVMLSALKTLGNIIELDEVCRQLVDEGGLKTIVNIANRYKDSSDIQLFAAMVLSGLSEIKDLDSDVIHTVDAALMKICSLDDPHLSMYACQAMENLLNTERGPRTFTDEKRLDVVLQMMRDFHDHPEIIRVCCKIIAMLALVKDIQKEIPYQAVTMVIESLKNFVQLDDLQIVGCGALSSLSENNEKLAQAIVESDGVGVLASALERHHSEERVHVIVMITLANLLPIDKEKYCSASETAALLIEQSMSMFPEIVPIQVAACEALAKFRIADLPDPSVLIDSLKHVLRRHRDKSELMKPAAAALKIFWQGKH